MSVGKRETFRPAPIKVWAALRAKADKGRGAVPAAKAPPFINRTGPSFLCQPALSLAGTDCRIGPPGRKPETLRPRHQRVRRKLPLLCENQPKVATSRSIANFTGAPKPVICPKQSAGGRPYKTANESPARIVKTPSNSRSVKPVSFCGPAPEKGTLPSACQARPPRTNRAGEGARDQDGRDDGDARKPRYTAHRISSVNWYRHSPRQRYADLIGQWHTGAKEV